MPPMPDIHEGLLSYAFNAFLICTLLGSVALWICVTNCVVEYMFRTCKGWKYMIEYVIHRKDIKEYITYRKAIKEWMSNHKETSNE